MFGFNIHTENNIKIEEQTRLIRELEEMDKDLREYVVVGNSNEASPARMVELRDKYLNKVGGDRDVEYQKMFAVRDKYKFLKNRF